uniref:Uncharacterized protein n=1 Tax=Magallana gigas TaxID=29159 RepID=K1PBM1_MAGGI
MPGSEWHDQKVSDPLDPLYKRRSGSEPRDLGIFRHPHNIRDPESTRPTDLSSGLGVPDVVTMVTRERIPIVCTESMPGSPKDSRDCGMKFTAYPSHSSCSLTIGNRHFICDTQKNVTDGTLDCSSTDYNPASNMQGDNNEANGKSPLSGSPMLLVCLVVLLLTCRLDYGDVFLELNV